MVKLRGQDTPNHRWASPGKATAPLPDDCNHEEVDEGPGGEQRCKMIGDHWGWSVNAFRPSPIKRRPGRIEFKQLSRPRSREIERFTGLEPNAKRMLRHLARETPGDQNCIRAEPRAA